MTTRPASFPSKHSLRSGSTTPHDVRWTRAAWASSLVGISLLLLTFVAGLEGRANDDTCVYFTYARQLVEGRGFTYDPREIPSEGFTSLLFLLMLVPWEAVGLNLHATAMALNLAALATTLSLASFALWRLELLRGPAVPLFAWISSVFVFRSADVSMWVDRALETCLAPCLVLAALYFTARSCAPHHERRGRSWLIASALWFVVIMARPETLIIYPLMLVLVGLMRKLTRLAFWSGAAVFVGSVLLYLGWKVLVLGDIFPTGYYRKIGGTAWFPGAEYVGAMIADYLPVLAVLPFACHRAAWRGPHKRVWCLGSLGVVVLMTVFCLRVVPIVGYAHRYLAIPIIMAFVLAAFVLASCLAWIEAKFARRRQLSVVLFAGVALALLVLSWPKRGLATVASRIDFAARAVEHFEQRHSYVKFGRFLRSKIARPETVTMVFGDAGCVPYTLGSRFVDTNGLTEPAIAKLFGTRSMPELEKKLVDHVLATEPDLVVLATDTRDDRTRRRNTPIALSRNGHSPFGKRSTAIQLHKAYSTSGFLYHCSMKSTAYDLHFGTNPSSPQYSAVGSALSSFCETDEGYFLPGDLTVVGDGERVTFPGHFDRRSAQNPR